VPYIEDVLEEFGDNALDPTTDIKEILADEQPGGGDTFALEQQDATLVYVIPWKKRRAFTRYVLGFSYADRSSPYRMRRENPIPHPSTPMLRAQTIHFSAVGIKAYDDNEEDDGDILANVPAVFTDEGLAKTGSYDMCWATVRFVNYPWTFRPDVYVTAVADELNRNFYADPVPSVELLAAEGGTSQLQYSETDPAGGAVKGTVIGTQFATQVAKFTYNYHWMWVAEQYLSSDPYVFSPDNLMSRVTMVNRTAFLGKRAGTMLMNAPQFQRFRFPIETYDNLYPFYGWNIRLPLVFFNPPKAIPDLAANYPGVAVDDIPRGHRCAPNRTNGKWVGAYREDKKHYLLQERDLYDGFRHISDPDGPALNGDPDPYA
jgi:hypothetical protein